jgi:hypothetical protein
MVQEHATYNCLCEKHDVLKSKPQTDIIWPWDLLIVITNDNLIGNWRCLNCIGTSVGIIGIRGNNIFSPRNLPFKIMASITYFINFLMTNRASPKEQSQLHYCSTYSSLTNLPLSIQLLETLLITRHSWLSIQTLKRPQTLSKTTLISYQYGIKIGG